MFRLGLHNDHRLPYGRSNILARIGAGRGPNFEWCRDEARRHIGKFGWIWQENIREHEKICEFPPKGHLGTRIEC